MAYTSVIPVHRLKNSVEYVLNPDKTNRALSAASLEEAVGYALNRDKTEQELFETALGCRLKSAFEDMCLVKQAWNKTAGVQGYHLVQSFAPGEATPELAHKIGLEFAGELLGEEFQAIIGTHLNTKCIHNHIVWNSVSMKSGRKYRSTERIYVTEVRAISDKLCQKYGLSVIQTERADRVARPYVQWKAEREQMPTWKTVIQQDVDAAIASTFTWRQFLSALERQGYAIRLDRKYITLRPPGKERDVRFKTLGPRYTPEVIQRRILEPKALPPAGRKAPRRARLRAGGKLLHGHSSLRTLYYVYLYRMGVLPRKPAYPGYEVREDIRRLDKRIEQMAFLTKHSIDDRGQLANLRTKAEGEMKALENERFYLYHTEPDSARISQISARLKGLRRTVKLCRDIAVQSEEMERRMQADRQTAQRLQVEKSQADRGRKNQIDRS